MVTIALGEPLNVDNAEFIKVANRNQGIGDGGGYKRKFPSIKDDYDGPRTEALYTVWLPSTSDRCLQYYQEQDIQSYNNLSGDKGNNPKKPCSMKSEIVSKNVSHVICFLGFIQV